VYECNYIYKYVCLHMPDIDFIVSMHGCFYVKENRIVNRNGSVVFIAIKETA